MYLAEREFTTKKYYCIDFKIFILNVNNVQNKRMYAKQSIEEVFRDFSELKVLGKSVGG